MAINEKMKRASAFDAFLPRRIVQERQNLTICTKTIVVALDLTETGLGPRAVGVFLEDENVTITGAGKKTKAPRWEAKARKEVILCAGAIATPQLLLLR